MAGIHPFTPARQLRCIQADTLQPRGAGGVPAVLDDERTPLPVAALQGRESSLGRGDQQITELFGRIRHEGIAAAAHQAEAQRGDIDEGLVLVRLRAQKHIVRRRLVPHGPLPWPPPACARAARRGRRLRAHRWRFSRLKDTARSSAWYASQYSARHTCPSSAGSITSPYGMPGDRGPCGTASQGAVCRSGTPAGTSRNCCS